MSESSKRHSALDAVWRALEAENAGRIEQLESRLSNTGRTDDEGNVIRALEHDLNDQDRSLGALHKGFAEIDRQFERRFEAISMMDIEPRNAERLKAAYSASDISRRPDDFILYRVIGNDLYPRHRKGQSRENLRFILENEKPLKHCEKRWIVNRIIDRDEEQAVLALLDEFEQTYIHIVFDENTYRDVDFDTDCMPGKDGFAGEMFANLGEMQQQRGIAAAYRNKNNYVMNNNGARNAALDAGKSQAKWVLPWDGNCFVTPSAWDRIREDVVDKPWLKYFAVPMTRVTDNDALINDDFQPAAVEEPQLIFRCDSTERFDEAYCYGRRPKVELFWRLGIPGKWDSWKIDDWDLPKSEPGPESKQYGLAGWVARLYSGMANLEQSSNRSFKERGRVRQDAILATLQLTDQRMVAERTASKGFNTLDDRVLAQQKADFDEHRNPLLLRRIDQLVIHAEEALERGPWSVVDKTTLPPGGNLHDYWHPAPYWWPNPDTADGLPYVKRDGERVPGTQLYEPQSDKYDRTRVQRLFDDTLALALSWYFTRDMRYAVQGAKLLRHFFLEETTRMTPHLAYAQVRMGKNKNRGMSSGIIEFKDLYFYLDAVRILESASVLPSADIAAFKAWLSEYLEWLLTSPQGVKESVAFNNHGPYYDLQVCAIASFLDRQDVLYTALIRAQNRVSQHFERDGSQPEELKRTTSQHYCSFNLQGWIYLANLAERWGVDLWRWRSSDSRSLSGAIAWLIARMKETSWPFSQIEPFDTDRYEPIIKAAEQHGIVASGDVSRRHPCTIKPSFFAHDGIRPYWNIGEYYEANIANDNLDEFYFAIPLKPRYMSTDWSLVESNLQDTINSIRKNAPESFKIVLAYHDMPSLDDWSMQHVEFIHCGFAGPEGASEGHADRHRKARAMGAHIKSQMAGNSEGVYFYLVDADDLVSPTIVSEVRQRRDLLGYYVKLGYKYDVSDRALILVDDFYRGCGSCSVGFFMEDEMPSRYNDRHSYFSRWFHRKHSKATSLIACKQIKLSHFDHRAAIYRINHAESQEMNQVGVKAYRDERVVKDSSEALRILNEFGLENGRQS